MCLICGIPSIDLDLVSWRRSCTISGLRAGAQRLVQQALFLIGDSRTLSFNEIRELDRPDRPCGAGPASPTEGGLP